MKMIIFFPLIQPWLAPTQNFDDLLIIRCGLNGEQNKEPKGAKATFHLNPGWVNYFLEWSVRGAVMVPISGGLAPKALKGCN